ncbi:hypothetical protein GW626_21020 [Peribacillus muralis]|uniref:hypothetical protein n=1 Tax=Peribacillus muralis TaxID=264697 RepID=UPI001F4DDFDB|nr:hypothetical protein [Peribacillus muralis]MCK1994365.1 hypothetical protein [Peribacillus muralis]MCK2014850.1 hypothetical protein [Peribacillus muralis]
MLSFKKITVGLIVIYSLAACDSGQVKKNEKVDAPKQNEVQDSTQQQGDPSFNTPRYHLNGGWKNEESYIMIRGISDIKRTNKYNLQIIPKKGKEKVELNLQLTQPTGNEIIALIDIEGSNRTSFLTLEMNKEKTELIIVMPNEEPVTYKKTDSMPFDFNSEYEWGN